MATFELQLKRIRKEAKRTQKDIAKELGIKLTRYQSWEQGRAMMSLEQAYKITEILDCTLEELVGRKRSNNIADTYERELIENYRASTPERQDRLIDTARDFAAMSKDGTKRDELSSPQASA